MTKDIAIVGAGKIGATIVDLLAACADYRVTVIDAAQAQLDALDAQADVERLRLDIQDEAALTQALGGKFAVLCATPFHLVTGVARAAKAAHAHYLDLTEDVAGTRRIRALAEGARTAFIPQCGLAPGFISIAAFDLTKRFDELADVRMGVGALPAYPTNALSYNLTWSTDGLINEYCEPCEAIVNGELRQTQALEDCEPFALDGVAYEAFNTSGGLGTLCETLAGQVRNLSYRTIRYPGHAAVMKTLLHDLRLAERRDVLKDILETALPATLQDVVIAFASVSGLRDGRLMQETYAHKIYGHEVAGKRRSAIQITTAAGICAVLDLLAQGHLPQAGFVRQEEVALDDFLANRFGRHYACAEPTLARVA